MSSRVPKKAHSEFPTGSHTCEIKEYSDNYEVDKATNDGWTALMLATRYTDMDNTNEIVKMLLKNKADVNKTNNYGEMALMLASCYSNTDSN